MVRMAVPVVAYLMFEVLALCFAKCQSGDESCAQRGQSMLQLSAASTAMGSSSLAPFSLGFASNSSADKHQPRRVYFDLGANWANTLRLYKDLANSSSVNQHPWEVYAFEASPLIVPCLDKFVSYLNGNGSKPELLWPPCGSTAHLSKYAERYGCPVGNAGMMRECMWKKFEQPLRKMVPEDSLMTNGVIQERMALAYSPPTAGTDRFTLIPAAAGGSAGTLHLGHVDAEQMIRGGALTGSRSGQQYDVPKVNFVSFLANNFRPEDYVVVKMDVEGGEFEIIQAMMNERDKMSGLTDILALECHSNVGDCVQLRSQCRQLAGTLVEEGSSFVEGSSYEGVDSESTPEKYFPKDPGLTGTRAAAGKVQPRWESAIQMVREWLR